MDIFLIGISIIVGLIVNLVICKKKNNNLLLRVTELTKELDSIKKKRVNLDAEYKLCKFDLGDSLYYGILKVDKNEYVDTSDGIEKNKGFNVPKLTWPQQHHHFFKYCLNTDLAYVSALYEQLCTSKKILVAQKVEPEEVLLSKIK